MTDTRPTTGWTRLRRRLRVDGNPMSRGSDRLAAWLPLAAVVAFLALTPLVVEASGAWMRADNAGARHLQLQTATAVLLQSAPGPAFSDNGANTWLDWVPARWTSDGQRHVSAIPVAAGTPAGSRVTVYFTSTGRVHTPPMTTGHARGRVLTAQLIAVANLAMVLALLALLGRSVLDRRRLASWQTEWLTVGPRWSHHS
jgi:hypothetical protein